jgi:hypothetical protein
MSRELSDQAESYKSMLRGVMSQLTVNKAGFPIMTLIAGFVFIALSVYYGTSQSCLVLARVPFFLAISVGF